jgi:hypothetical protein
LQLSKNSHLFASCHAGAQRTRLWEFSSKTER